MISGGNGILDKAGEAVEVNKVAAGKEQLELYYYELIATEPYGQASIGDYVEILNKNGIPTQEEDGKVKAEIDGIIYEITEKEDGTLDITHPDGEGGSGTITTPILNVVVTSQTSESIVIQVNSKNLDGAVYEYYISQVENERGSLKDNNTIGKYEYTGLTEGTYYITVVAKNADGIELIEKTVNVKVEKQEKPPVQIPSAEEDPTDSSKNPIIVGEIEWNDGIGSLPITKNENVDNNLKMEYKVNDGEWKEINSGDSIPNLKPGNTVEIRFTDGENSGTPLVITIKDEIVPTISTGADRK